MSIKYSHILVSDLTKEPEDGAIVQIMKNRWWIVTKEELPKVFVYNDCQQCNSTKSIAEYLLKSIQKTYPETELKFIDCIYFPVNPSDWTW